MGWRPGDDSHPLFTVILRPPKDLAVLHAFKKDIICPSALRKIILHRPTQLRNPHLVGCPIFHTHTGQ